MKTFGCDLNVGQFDDANELFQIDDLVFIKLIKEGREYLEAKFIISGEAGKFDLGIFLSKLIKCHAGGGWLEWMNVHLKEIQLIPKATMSAG